MNNAIKVVDGLVYVYTKNKIAVDTLENMKDEVKCYYEDFWRSLDREGKSQCNCMIIDDLDMFSITEWIYDTEFGSYWEGYNEIGREVIAFFESFKPVNKYLSQVA